MVGLIAMVGCGTEVVPQQAGWQEEFNALVANDMLRVACPYLSDAGIEAMLVAIDDSGLEKSDVLGIAAEGCGEIWDQDESYDSCYGCFVALINKVYD